MADNTPRPRKNKLLKEIEPHSSGLIVAPPLFRSRAEGRAFKDSLNPPAPKSKLRGSKSSNSRDSATDNSPQAEASVLPDASSSLGSISTSVFPPLPPQNLLQPIPPGLGSPSSSNTGHAEETHHIPTTNLKPKLSLPQLLAPEHKFPAPALQAPEPTSDPSSQNRPSQRPSFSDLAPKVSVGGTLDPSKFTFWYTRHNLPIESQSKSRSSSTSTRESLSLTKPVSKPSSHSKPQKSQQKLSPPQSSSPTREILDAPKPVPHQPYKPALSASSTILPTNLERLLVPKFEPSSTPVSTRQRQETELPAPIPPSHAKLNSKLVNNIPKQMDVNGNAPHPNGRVSISSSSQPIAVGATTTSSTALQANQAVPLTSSQDDGTSRRPRDERIIAILLSSLGVSDYQRRVPLQLLDFAYRHTSSILTDALHLSSDAYVSQQTRARDAPPGGGFRDADGQVSMSAIQLAIQSRLQYQFSGGNGGGLSKEFLLEQAEARNKVALPRIAPNEWGVRLPSEKYVLSGVPWGMKTSDEQESDTTRDGDADVSMGMDGVADEMAEGEEEGGTAADLFGEDLEDENMGLED